MTYASDESLTFPEARCSVEFRLLRNSPEAIDEVGDSGLKWGKVGER